MKSKFKVLSLAAIFFYLISSLQAQIVNLSGDIISHRTLSNDTIYLLQGFVYVKDGGILEIEAGTLIKGDKETKGSLIITRDGILHASGTAEQPIIFTSNQPVGVRAAGDWGGILILGNAPINAADINAIDPGNQAIIEGGVDNAFGDGQYGGTNLNDSRGELEYVRIEYPGIAFLPGNEINGLTLGGVGDGTVLNHLMVSNSGDDAFEFFGGNVNASYLVAHATIDDDFDLDFGYSGKIQFIVSLREPNIADISGFHGFESDNDATGSSNTPITSGVISNATIIGPIKNEGDIINVNYKRGMQLRRNTQLNIHNSVVIGFPSAVMIDGAACEINADAGTLEVKNLLIAGNSNNLEVASGSTWGIETWFNNAANANQVLSTADEVMLNDPFNQINPDFRPKVGSPVFGSADFTDETLSSGFTSVSYVGAFDDIVNWASCWTNWDPQNTNYSTPISGSTTPTESHFSYHVSTGTFDVEFMNESVGSSEYFWDFGVSGIDSDTSSLINPTYSYEGNGNYEVTLIALGCSVDTTIINVLVDSALTLNSHQAIQSISTFPNPVKDILFINIHLDADTETQLFLSDLSGRVILQTEQLKLASGSSSFQLDLSALSNGVYLLQIQANSERKTTKVVVNN